ncbi:hypothetical protein CPter291_3055 [Collimonas pratensis]|uniref:Uncharacterized protein n=1 Tax=Collimonas pratensis TaxID=279113 RepID=A0ABM5Z8Y7_9BURK|nr:hypothetical protein CPter291_3055 [Collimonas pratensis]
MHCEVFLKIAEQTKSGKSKSGQALHGNGCVAMQLLSGGV